MNEKQTGIDRLSSALGLKRAAILSIRDTVRANQDKLNACPRHAFAAIEPGRLLSRYRCANCGGDVDSSAAHWYGRGILHAGAQ